MPGSTSNKRSPVKGENLTIRMSSKTKFALELLARKERRSLTSIVELAIEKILESKRDELMVDAPLFDRAKGGYLPDLAWDPYYPDRLVKLAMYAENLLEYDEQVIWKTIKEQSSYWNFNQPIFERIRGGWEEISKQAKENAKAYG